jgi:hypothetical protein
MRITIPLWLLCWTLFLGGMGIGLISEKLINTAIYEYRYLMDNRYDPCTGAPYINAPPPSPVKMA